MRFICEANEPWNFEFWAGAKNTVSYLTYEELSMIWHCLEDSYEIEPIELSALPTETEINDFFWFETDTIAEWLGYKDFDELMEARKDEKR